MTYWSGDIIQCINGRQYTYIGYMYEIRFKVNSVVKLHKQNCHIYIPSISSFEDNFEEFLMNEVTKLYFKGKNIQDIALEHKRRIDRVINKTYNCLGYKQNTITTEHKGKKVTLYYNTGGR